MVPAKKRPARSYFNPTVRHVWLAVPLLLSFILLCIDPLHEGDLWWHIQIGEDILLRGQIPAQDSYSFTATGLPYFSAHSWLSDLGFYVLYKAGGLSALVMLQALVGTAVIGLLVYESDRRGASARATAMIILIGWIGLYPFSTSRPQIFSFLAFTLFGTLLSSYVNRQHNRLYLLPLVMLAWVNLHNGWVIGVLQLLVAIGLVGAKVITNHEAPGRLGPLLLWGATTMITTWINPSGMGVYKHIITVGSNAINQQFVSEWQPLTITNSLSWPFFILLAVLIFALAYSRTRPALYELLLVGIFTGLTLRYLRFLPFSLIILPPLLAELASHINWRISLPGLNGLLIAKSTQNPTALNRILLLILAFVALISTPMLRLPLIGQTEATLIDPYFPLQATDILIAQATPGSRVFSLPEWGGFLIWRLYPKVSVFSDGRVELYPLAVWQDYLRIISASPEGLSLLDRYQINYLVLSKERQSQLALAVETAGWQRIFEDQISWIFVRTNNPEEIIK